MIKANSVYKTLGGTEVLKNMSCEIKDGTIYGLIGANGTGKSTFLRMISGIYYTDGGELTVDGKPIFDDIEVKNEVIFVSDDFYIPNGYTVEDLAKLYACFYKTFDYGFFWKNIDILGLPLKKRITNFSKGMKRQVVMLCALACKCRYTLFDETFDGLDPVVRNMMKNLIYSEVAERNATVIMTSHNLRELEDICDCLGVLYNGSLLFDGDITSIKSNVFKVQIALPSGTDESVFDKLTVMDKKKSGSVYTLIIKGDIETEREKLEALSPILLDIIPLTLEEVFIYEMEVLGYAYEKLGI